MRNSLWSVIWKDDIRSRQRVRRVGGWVGGWVDGWMGGPTGRQLLQEKRWNMMIWQERHCIKNCWSKIAALLRRDHTSRGQGEGIWYSYVRVMSPSKMSMDKMSHDEMSPVTKTVYLDYIMCRWKLTHFTGIFAWCSRMKVRLTLSQLVNHTCLWQTWPEISGFGGVLKRENG